DEGGGAERLVGGLERGGVYGGEHRDEVIEFARGMFGGDDTRAVEADFASSDRVVGLDRITFEDFQKLGGWMMEAGLLKAPFDRSAFFDPAPLRTSLPDRVAPEFP